MNHKHEYKETSGKIIQLEKTVAEVPHQLRSIVHVVFFSTLSKWHKMKKWEWLILLLINRYTKTRYLENNVFDIYNKKINIIAVDQFLQAMKTSCFFMWGAIFTDRNFTLTLNLLYFLFSNFQSSLNKKWLRIMRKT